MHRRTGVLIAAALAISPLAACGGDDDASATPSTAAAVTTTTTTEASTATSETTTSEAATTTAPVPAADLVLRGDGLGVVALGAGPEEALAAVRAVLGEPTADTGWESSFGPYGTCPGERVRGVEWDHLVLLFADGETSYGSGQHLFAWRITGAPPALGTASGFGYRATIADAEDLYPGAFEVVPPRGPVPGLLADRCRRRHDHRLPGRGGHGHQPRSRGGLRRVAGAGPAGIAGALSGTMAPP